MTDRTWPSGTVLIVLLWGLGTGGLLLLGNGSLLGGSAAGLLGTVSLLVGMGKRRALPLDASLLAPVAILAMHDLDPRRLLMVAVALAPLAVCFLAHTLARNAIRQSPAPMGAIVAKATPKLLAAVGLALVVVQSVEWSAALVSTRWTDSLDRSSTAMKVVLGALFLSLAATLTAGRVAMRRMKRTDPDRAQPNVRSAPGP